MVASATSASTNGGVALAHDGDVEARKREGQDGQDGDGALHRHHHTFFTGARPNKPLGISASAPMTTVNITICV